MNRSTLISRCAFAGLALCIVALTGCDLSTSPDRRAGAWLPFESEPLPAPPPSTFPPLTGPSRTFVFDRELGYPVSYYTTASRFVLYDNGAFVLETGTGGYGYRGGYIETNGAIDFSWEGWSVGGRWGATGVIQGRSLTVNYNLIMQMTDFEDAVYVLMP